MNSQRHCRVHKPQEYNRALCTKPARTFGISYLYTADSNNCVVKTQSDFLTERAAKQVSPRSESRSSAGNKNNNLYSHYSGRTRRKIKQTKYRKQIIEDIQLYMQYLN